MPIEDERIRVARPLATALGVSEAAAVRAIDLARARYGRGSLISILSTSAQLGAALGSMDEDARSLLLDSEADGGGTWRQAVLDGAIERALCRVTETLAGRSDVAWDGNWPSAAPRLRGRIPDWAREGDVIIGGDGGGTRTMLRVFADTDGTLTACEVPDSWRDPPFEEVFSEEWNRLAARYPDQLPPGYPR